MSIAESEMEARVMGILIIFPRFPLNKELLLEYIKNLYFLAPNIDWVNIKPVDLSETKLDESAEIENLGKIIILPCIDLWFPQI